MVKICPFKSVHAFRLKGKPGVSKLISAQKFDIISLSIGYFLYTVVRKYVTNKIKTKVIMRKKKIDANFHGKDLNNLISKRVSTYNFFGVSILTNKQFQQNMFGFKYYSIIKEIQKYPLLQKINNILTSTHIHKS